jgi:hypothetical protein
VTFYTGLGRNDDLIYTSKHIFAKTDSLINKHFLQIFAFFIVSIKAFSVSEDHAISEL